MTKSMQKYQVGKCLSTDFLIFFFEKFLYEMPSVSDSLDTDQAQHFVRPGLYRSGPTICQAWFWSKVFARLSVDDTSSQRVKR